jgi:predicted ester cyclase
MSHSTLIESFYAANGPMADDATLERTFHPDYVSHTSPPETPHGLPTALELREFLGSTFSDVRYRLVKTVVEGDMAAAYTMVSGRYTGDTFGFPGTGKSYEAEQMHLLRFADDGRIVEHWGVRDDAGMMQQIKAG